MNSRNRAALAFAFTLSLGFGACPSVDAADAQSELRNSLFDDANDALAAANAAQASILAPRSYGEGTRYYRDAEERLADEGAIDAIRRDLGRAQAAFAAAAAHAADAAALFDAALQARRDAQSAEAERYAAQAWEDAQKQLGEATLAFERGREGPATRGAEAAEALYRESELGAIRTNYLTETQQLLAEAEALRAERYAPRSFANATELLAEASRALGQDRYDTDRPRDLARRAKSAAQHAIYVSRLEEAIRRRQQSLEDILFEWEGGIESLAAQLDLSVAFDDGQGNAVTRVREAIEALQAENRELADIIGNQEDQLRELSGTAERAAELDRVLAQQQARQARIDGVEALFAAEEATVLRQGEDLIIRMIGLNFASGKSEILPDYFPLLTRLRQALEAFPGNGVVIEGHTDAYGSDALNLTLSQQRADAVRQYLLANTRLAAAAVQAVGFGEASPVASNESDAGRRRNRRIDVIIEGAAVR